MQLFTIVTGPVGRVLGLILLMAVFGLGLGTINSWFLQTVDAGVVNNERFDRVVAKGSHTSADDAWATVTAVVKKGATAAAAVATSAYEVANDSGNCKIQVTGVASGTTYYTPSGTEINTSGTSGQLAGCKWEVESAIFKAAGFAGLIDIVLQAIGLAGPVLLLTEVGSFANSFTKRVGANPVLSIIITLIVLLLVGSMMQTFVPFLSDAYAAIDSKRFLMYDTGLGKLATVIRSFLGVVLVAGLLMLGWTLWQNLRGGNLLTSGQRM